MGIQSHKHLHYIVQLYSENMFPSVCVESVEKLGG